MKIKLSDFFYLDEGEALTIFDNIDNPDGTKSASNYTELFPVHVCKTFDMYRNVDGEKVYNRVYLFLIIFHHMDKNFQHKIYQMLS